MTGQASSALRSGISAGSRLAAMNAVRGALEGRSTVLEVAEAVAEVALEFLAADSAAVNRYNADRKEYRTIVNVGSLNVSEVRFPDDETYPASLYPVVTQLLLAGQGYHSSLTDEATVPDENLRTMARFGKSTCLGAPIVYRGQPWGELFVSRDHGRDPFTDDDLSLARDLAQQIAFGVVRAEAAHTTTTS